MTVEVQREAGAVRIRIAPRARAARTALLVLAFIWIAFAAVWTVLIVSVGGSIVVALAAFVFVPAGLAVAGRMLAGLPERCTVVLEAGRGLTVSRRGGLRHRATTVALADVGEARVAAVAGPGGRQRPALRVATRAGDLWLGEGLSVGELERLAAVFNEGVRAAQAPAP